MTYTVRVYDIHSFNSVNWACAGGVMAGRKKRVTHDVAANGEAGRSGAPAAAGASGEGGDDAAHARRRDAGSDARRPRAAAPERASVGGSLAADARTARLVHARWRWCRPRSTLADREGLAGGDDAGRVGDARLHDDGHLSLLPQQGIAVRRHRRRRTRAAAGSCRSAGGVARGGDAVGAREA